MRHSLRTAIISGTALVVTCAGGALATVATAASTPIPAHTVHGCVTGSSRTLEHVFTVPSNGTKCPKGSFMVVLPTGAPLAGTPGQPGASEVQQESSVIQVADHDDSGTAGNWAKDTYARQMTVIGHGAADASHCDGAPGCTFYTGSFLDAGSFTTVNGAQSPAGGVAIPGTITGQFNGGASFQFYSDSSALHPSTLTAVEGGPGSSDTSWPASFLPTDAHVYSYSLLSWGWTYTAPGTCEQWVNSLAGNSGDITGVNACKS